MLLSAILSLLLLSPVPEVQKDQPAPVVRQAQHLPECNPERSEGSDTLKAARVSSTAGSLIVPQRIESHELRSVTSISEAVRRFAGVQLRDYGGIGGLKTVNVRSLGSEHTGVFIDGIQIDNAQNMQVDLGRFGLEDIRSVSLFSGQKVSPLQSAKEYSSASALYLESAEPVFKDGSRNNTIVSLGAGSFGTWSPRLSLEHLFKDGKSLRIGCEAVATAGKYRFHVSDYRLYPDGTVAGYDTTMIRRNGDLRSARFDARLYSSPDSRSSWNLHAHFYDSERGLPGPVYKREGGYPLSEDRQSDLDAFLQGRLSLRLSDVWSFAARSKLSFSHLEYVDVPELRPELPAAHFNYLNHSAYLSAAAMARLGNHLRLNFAQDLQYDYLDADLMDFAYPGRLSSWSCASAMYGLRTVELSATMLFLDVHDTFLSGGERSSARRNVLMPSFVARWKPSERFSVDGFVKRSYRMPTFNDLYYTTVGSKTLDPEDAFQTDLGARWTALSGSGHTLQFNADIYRNILKNKIIAVPTSNQFRWSMYNIGKVSVLGADLVADYAFREGRLALGGTARYSYLHLRDQGWHPAAQRIGQSFRGGRRLENGRNHIHDRREVHHFGEPARLQDRAVADHRCCSFKVTFLQGP